MCILLVEVYRFGQCLGEIFLLLSTFFSLVSSRAFRDAPHSSFTCSHPNQCLPSTTFSPPPNLHTCVSLVESYRFAHCLGWTFSNKSSLFSIVSFRPFRDSPLSRCRCGNPNQCLPNFLKMLLLALPQIYTRVFELWKSIDLDSA